MTYWQAPTIGCYYTEVDRTVHPELVAHVIGCDGRVLKAIHRRFPGCLYIWFNNDSAAFEIYSSSHDTNMKVRQAILERMDRIRFQWCDTKFVVV